MTVLNQVGQSTVAGHPGLRGAGVDVIVGQELGLDVSAMCDKL